jgi:hypothetical protein
MSERKDKNTTGQDQATDRRNQADGVTADVTSPDDRGLHVEPNTQNPADEKRGNERA